MLTANCGVSFDLFGEQLDVYAMSQCVVLNGDFTFCFSVCQLVVLLCRAYYLKLHTLSVGANDLCC